MSSTSGKSGKYTTQYTYDGVDRLIESVTTDGTRKQSNSTYAYNQKGKVSKYIQQNYFYNASSDMSVDTWTYTPEYNQKGQMSKCEFIITRTSPASTPIISISTYEYDSQGNRIKVSTSTNGFAPGVDLYEYKDGNCIKSTFGAGRGDEVVTVYEYYMDQEYKARTMPHLDILGPSVSKNMIKKLTKTSSSTLGPNKTVTTTEHIHEYNDKGYPVKTTVINTSGGTSSVISVSMFEYACQ